MLLKRFQEDDPSIEMENNIENHYIAECESCGGIFISAILESDQEIDHVTGVCPLCEKKPISILNGSYVLLNLMTMKIWLKMIKKGA